MDYGYMPDLSSDEQEKIYKYFIDFRDYQELKDTKESVNLIHEAFIKKLKDNLVNNNFYPACYVLIRDLVEDKFGLMIYPMAMKSINDLEMHKFIITTIISALKKESSKRIISVTSAIESSVSFHEPGELLDKTGNFKENIEESLKDSETQSMFLIIIEEQFFKRVMLYETITNDAKDIVINPKPKIDDKQILNPLEVGHLIGNYFTEVSTSNN